MVTALIAATLLSKPMDYTADIQQWRTGIDSDLKSDYSWLTVAGLFWLKPGDNSIGAGEGNAVKLPEDSAPERVGTLTYQDGKVTLKVNPGVDAQIDSKTVQGSAIIYGIPDQGKAVSLNRLLFKIIPRGNRIGVRLYDLEAKQRKEFTGLKWFPVSLNYKVEATLEPFNPPKSIPIKNVLGDTLMAPAAGTLLFTLNGQTCTLTAEKAGDGLFINFRDLTSGDTTYGAGRFLDADAPKDGKVTIDFNKATCPPCAYTNFATCPLPPRENFLNTKVEAGELAFHHE